MPDAGLGAGDRGANAPCPYTRRDGCRRELGQAEQGLLLTGFQASVVTGLREELKVASPGTAFKVARTACAKALR